MSETPDIWREIGPALADAVAEARWPAGEGARLLDADGLPVALEQADLFPPVRVAEIMAALTMIADLRAVAAPLLDEPYTYGGCDDCGSETRCLFCRVEMTIGRRWTGRLDTRGRRINEDDDTTVHAPDCPVLRRDELLGR
jgi:hypothetical protein